MPTRLVNPLDETARPAARPAARLDSLRDKTIGLLDISKPGGSHYLNRLEELLTERYGVQRIVRKTKPTFTRPAPEAVLDFFRSEGCHAVVEALAD